MHFILSFLIYMNLDIFSYFIDLSLYLYFIKSA